MLLLSYEFVWGVYGLRRHLNKTKETKSVGAQVKNRRNIPLAWGLTRRKYSRGKGATIVVRQRAFWTRLKFGQNGSMCGVRETLVSRTGRICGGSGIVSNAAKVRQ